MKKDVFWNSIGTAAWSFLSLFLLIIVTRINGIDASGSFSYALAFAFIMFTIVCYGGRAYQVSDQKNSFSPNDYIVLRLLTSCLVILTTIIFVIFSGYDWDKSVLILILVVQRIFDGIADVFYGILQKKNRLYISGQSLFFKSILSLFVFLGIDLLTNNLLLSSLSLPIISLLFMVIYDIPQSRKIESFRVTPNNNDIKLILGSTFFPFIIAIMSLIFVNLARYFIDVYYPELQGYFGIIIMPLSLVLLLFSFISTPAILHLTQAYNNKDFARLNLSIMKIVVSIFFGTILLSVLTYFFGTPFLKLLFTIDFSEYITDIVLVIIIGFAISLTALFTNIAVIARRFRFTVLMYLTSNLLLGILCILLVSEYQIGGAIISYIAVSILQTISMTLYVKYLTSTPKNTKKH